MLVVLADKDPYDLQALQAILEGPGREVIIVGDGENVVTLARSRSPEVVVVGSSLGHMGGFAVSRDLKTLADQGVIADPLVIVLLEREADAWVAGWSRCDAWRTKPVDAAEIDALIDELAGQPTA